MKRFLCKIGIAFLIVILFHLVSAFSGDGKTDSYYLRFTTPKQHALILGTSRAAQGIHPQLLDTFLNAKDLQGPIYNFAFTLTNSPYGPDYLKAIKAKVASKTHNGFFILAVDPWVISNRNNPSDSIGLYRESDLFLGNLNCYNCNPNFEYLFKFYEYNWGHIFAQKMFERQLNLNSRGRLVVDVPMDSSQIAIRIEEKIAYYDGFVNQYTPSKKRLDYLKQTIEFLNRHGKVVLVRIPVIEPLLKFENSFYPHFDELIAEVALEFHIPYYNFKEYGELYSYTDGNHLSQEGGALFTKNLVAKMWNDF